MGGVVSRLDPAHEVNCLVQPLSHPINYATDKPYEEA